MQAPLDVLASTLSIPVAALPFQDGRDFQNSATVGKKGRRTTTTKPLAFLDTMCPMPNDSAVLPAQAPNLQRRGGPARLTSLAPRPQERGSHSSSSEDVPENISVRRPHMAQAFTVSTGILCPKSTISLKTTWSFSERKKKSSPCRPYLFGTSQMLAVVSKPKTSPMVQKRPLLSQQYLIS